MSDALQCLHPAVGGWFRNALGEPTAAQAGAWPTIAGGEHTLIAAPTGSGKTLAAFLAAIDALVRHGVGTGGLPPGVQVLYVSPLKALSNDIEKNLQAPLNGIRDELLMQGRVDVPIRTAVRTGDTPASERERMRRDPPHILVTTPESLYILLTAESGRDMLASVGTIIIDEIHALVGNKRGAHLSLSIERLEALIADRGGRPPTRIGMSATARPMSTVERFLMGNRPASAILIDTGHSRDRDLSITVPASPLETVMSAEVWTEIHERLETYALTHHTTLVFVNTRRHAERIAKAMGERLGTEAVAAHHGSLSRAHRLDAEQRLKNGDLRLMVATASLELGIDIGDVDLVCQIGSPRGLSAFLQRVGRSGHAVGGTPKGRLFPLSRDDLVECAALLHAVQLGVLDTLAVLNHPLDVLAQQIVADTACREWDEQALFEQIRCAWPYRDLQRADFDAVIRMLAEGYSTRRGRRSAWIHHDGVNGRLRGRRGARLTAITNGGAIPDLFDYDVHLEPEGLFIGTLNEDFAFESLPGDIFQLGNTSYRVLRVQMGKVHVEDAQGQPPNIPFWFGEAPGRSDALSAAVSRLRAQLAKRYERGDSAETVQRWLTTDLGLGEGPARQLDDYLRASHAALGCLPDQNTIVLERFFDEAGDNHLVVHSTYGSRLNRGWGLALRKRFCRSFNFELQAAALEDSIVLSLGAVHSFELNDVAAYLKSANVRQILTQAMFDSPLFESRWRWNATCALALQRFRSGKRVPPQLQRMNAEDLSAVVFPDHLACLENIQGDREIPDHPLVHQTIADALTEAMDIDMLEQVLERLEHGAIKVVARDLTEPSPLACEVLNARPYAFLDDAPAEERRTQMVRTRRHLDPQDARDLGQLDPEAIARVRQEAWPTARNADELHEALVLAGCLTEDEAQRCAGESWKSLFKALLSEQRVLALTLANGALRLAAAERARELFAVWPDCAGAVIQPGSGSTPVMDETDAWRELVRSRLEISGPITVDALGRAFGLDTPTGHTAITSALMALEAEGFAMQGRFESTTPVYPQVGPQWCDRRLLARIHRYTVKRLRADVEPVSAQVMMRHLLLWQSLTRTPKPEGPESLYSTLEQMQGYEAPANAWENALLMERVGKFKSADLDHLCRMGRILWCRLTPATTPQGQRSGGGPVSQTPIALLPREHAAMWRSLAGPTTDGEIDLGSSARTVRDTLRVQGASFFAELVSASGLLNSQVEDGLRELANLGLVSCDSFEGLRGLIAPAASRRRQSRRKGGRAKPDAISNAGRWAMLPQPPHPGATDDAIIEHVAWTLLRRYGVVFRALLAREGRWLPPWRSLLYVYRRLEARGDIRGGRFVERFSGEQYALPEALAALRRLRTEPGSGELVSLSAADPLNLVGVVLPGEKLPALTSNRILFRDGVTIARRAGKTIEYEEKGLSPAAQWNLRERLLGHNPSPRLKALKP
ncbi:MAG: DEAD/DEAH box helicase [Gammaproteobacteria bacterium]